MATRCATRVTRGSPVRAWNGVPRASCRRPRVARASEGENASEKAGGDGERGMDYYKGLVTEPVREGDVGDVITPTVKLVTRASVAIGGLFLGFLYSNGLPPFGG